MPSPAGPRALSLSGPGRTGPPGPPAPALHPPPFAKGRTQLEAAARGYKEINLRALRLLERGGSLLTFSCSYHVSAERFEAICREAAADAGVRARVVAPLGQGRDHPIVPPIPQTRPPQGPLLQAA